MKPDIFNNLISWNSEPNKVTDLEWNFAFAINKDSEVFNGHFPDQPILPGVVMIALVKQGVEKVLGMELILKEAANFKFLKMVNPIEVSSGVLELKIQEQEGEVKAKGVITVNGEAFFKASATYLK